MLRIASISLLVLLTFSLGCKKDKVPCTSCPTSSGAGCEDIQNVKHFFYFKVGSWWVYEEENSGARDSVYVTSAVEDPSNYNFNVEVYSSYQDYTYRYWPQYGPTVGSNCSQNGLACGWCTKVFRSKYKPGDFVSQATCFIFQPEVGLSDYNSNPYYAGNYIYVTELLDSFVLNSFDLERTVELTEDNTIMEGYQPTKHQYSENIGLIRKELLDSNEVWNLVDYYIVP